MRVGLLSSHDARVSAVFRELPDEQRDALALAALAPLDYDEMAAIVGRDVGDFAAMVAAGRLRMAELIDGRTSSPVPASCWKVIVWRSALLDHYRLSEPHAHAQRRCRRCEHAAGQVARGASVLAAMEPVVPPPDLRARVMRLWRDSRDRNESVA